MTKVVVVGIGPGNPDYIMPKAVEIMNKSDVIIGFSRALQSLDFINVPKIKVCRLDETIELINSKKYDTISVAASGDPMFYGITDYLKKNYKNDIQIVPGISSFQYFMSRLGKSWQNSGLYSIHGRKEELIKKIRGNRVSIWLVDKTNTPNYICRELMHNKIKAKVYVGENLSYGDEKIYIGTPDEIFKVHYSDLCVVVVENGDDKN